MNKFRFQVHRQHGGTGFPMGVLYATNDGKEAMSVARSLMAMETGNVYFSVSDCTKPSLKRSRFIHHKDAALGTIPKVILIELDRCTPDNCYFWATLHFANGWKKGALWPNIDGSPADSLSTVWGQYYDFKETTIERMQDSDEKAL